MYKITFTGDLMSLPPENKAAKHRKGFDYSPIFSSIRESLKKSDYVIGNLETPLAAESEDWTHRDTEFNTPSVFAKAAKDAGFKCFSISNNHCLDRGIPGLMSTIKELDSIGIDHTGTYISLPQSQEILVKKFGGVKVAFLSFSYGTNSEWQNNKLAPQERFHVDLIKDQNEFKGIRDNKLVYEIKRRLKIILPQSIREKIRPIVISDCVRNEVDIEEVGFFRSRLEEKIKKAKEEADLVIMLLHCGGQYNNSVGDYTRNVCKTIISMGCDVIVTNHPHCVLNHEYIDGKLVLYSLGNFCFTPNYGFYYKGVYADYSLLFHLYINDQGDIFRKSVQVCKVVKEKNGHSVVYPLYNLINKVNGKRQKKLINDNFCVLDRFFQKSPYKQEILQEYFF